MLTPPDVFFKKSNWKTDGTPSHTPATTPGPVPVFIPEIGTPKYRLQSNALFGSLRDLKIEVNDSMIKDNGTGGSVSSEDDPSLGGSPNPSGYFDSHFRLHKNAAFSRKRNRRNHRSKRAKW
ncbi:hypothetical protein LPJ66_002591 [Kickxella alabastrina]|uniref:Uncharacterized protein n=1 Tax=Kickxella alabastrina TaxID=61397 RepID=A0ACC1IQ12_9FUNG|nr:hypothetical protein LPJ66_002591 [Kickxella alabastrina]